MFCPKCGTKNPENGKFCRSCGTDLSPVSEALAGKRQRFGMIDPVQPSELWDRKGKPLTFESAFGKLFMGLAFLIVSIILAFSGRAGQWWFWMLIPAFGMLGSGIAQIIQLKKYEKGILPASATAEENKPLTTAPNAALPPPQNDYIAPRESVYKTGDLVPPSVVEETTRHLEINQEGETMTLPQKK